MTAVDVYIFGCARDDDEAMLRLRLMGARVQSTAAPQTCKGTIRGRTSRRGLTAIASTTQRTPDVRGD